MEKVKIESGGDLNLVMAAAQLAYYNVEKVKIDDPELADITVKARNYLKAAFDRQQNNNHQDKQQSDILELERMRIANILELERMRIAAGIITLEDTDPELKALAIVYLKRGIYMGGLKARYNGY